VGGLERRDDPLEDGEAAEGGERLRIGDRDVARAAGVAQEGVLRAGAGIVEPRRDRVRLGDLALVVLEHRRVGTVEHPAAATGGERGAVAPGVDSLPARLDAHELDPRVVQERREGADGVRPPAHAGDHARGQAAAGLR
jgi:hypothetical protein